ncbi:hypothetical protein HYH03_001923 [Edaphochlamys debaryana]|uniref:RWP-RK domain-containing protein n=1 Tax=Edaphochlamys debaryana TaxID=47281 RepID=A0A836C5Y4_9CHLO|nr:hypothetical protein HYH03_001923 [Edaphochlamys debaryana]|eukprot:KAG2500349.1 hypothetical protein HYH03_001923 [Edaphochlamys debaryana]
MKVKSEQPSGPSDSAIKRIFTDAMEASDDEEERGGVGGGATGGAGGDRDADDAVSLGELQSVYHLPSKEAARSLGISLSRLKRSCRAHNVHRWPHRKLSSLHNLRDTIRDDKNMKSHDKERILSRIAQEIDAVTSNPDHTIDTWLDEIRQAKYKLKYYHKTKHIHAAASAAARKKRLAANREGSAKPGNGEGSKAQSGAASGSTSGGGSGAAGRTGVLGGSPAPSILTAAGTAPASSVITTATAGGTTINLSGGGGVMSGPHSWVIGPGSGGGAAAVRAASDVIMGTLGGGGGAAGGMAPPTTGELDLTSRQSRAMSAADPLVQSGSAAAAAAAAAQWQAGGGAAGNAEMQAAAYARRPSYGITDESTCGQPTAAATVAADGAAGGGSIEWERAGGGRSSSCGYAAASYGTADGAADPILSGRGQALPTNASGGRASGGGMAPYSLPYSHGVVDTLPAGAGAPGNARGSSTGGPWSSNASLARQASAPTTARHSYTGGFGGLPAPEDIMGTGSGGGGGASATGCYTQPGSAAAAPGPVVGGRSRMHSADGCLGLPPLAPGGGLAAYDARYDGRYESRYDSRYDARYDARYEQRYHEMHRGAMGHPGSGHPYYEAPGSAYHVRPHPHSAVYGRSGGAGGAGGGNFMTRQSHTGSNSGAASPFAAATAAAAAAHAGAGGGLEAGGSPFAGSAAGGSASASGGFGGSGSGSARLGPDLSLHGAGGWRANADPGPNSADGPGGRDPRHVPGFASQGPRSGPLLSTAGGSGGAPVMTLAQIHDQDRHRFQAQAQAQAHAAQAQEAQRQHRQGSTPLPGSGYLPELASPTMPPTAAPSAAPPPMSVPLPMGRPPSSHGMAGGPDLPSAFEHPHGMHGHGGMTGFGSWQAPSDASSGGSGSRARSGTGVAATDELLSAAAVRASLLGEPRGSGPGGRPLTAADIAAQLRASATSAEGVAAAVMEPAPMPDRAVTTGATLRPSRGVGGSGGGSGSGGGAVGNGYGRHSASGMYWGGSAADGPAVAASGGSAMSLDDLRLPSAHVAVGAAGPGFAPPPLLVDDAMAYDVVPAYGNAAAGGASAGALPSDGQQQADGDHEMAPAAPPTAEKADADGDGHPVLVSGEHAVVVAAAAVMADGSGGRPDGAAAAPPSGGGGGDGGAMLASFDWLLHDNDR